METPLRPRELNMSTLDRDPQPETEPSADPLLPATMNKGETDARPKRVKRSSMFMSTPDTAPPQLLCPSCDRPLVYRQTVISGVKPIERWDYFECRTCGSFVYRDRRRRLRPTS